MPRNLDDLAAEQEERDILAAFYHELVRQGHDPDRVLVALADVQRTWREAADRAEALDDAERQGGPAPGRTTVHPPAAQ